MVGAVVAAASCSPTDSAVPEASRAAEMDSLTVLDALVSGTAVNSAGDQVDLLIDVALPALDGDSHPVVVFVQGGGFAFGSRTE